MDVVNNDGNVNRQIHTLDGIKLISVPASRMTDAPVFGTDGYTPGGNQVHAIILHPSAIVAPTKLNDASFDEASAITGGVNLFFMRIYLDLFVIESRNNGITYYTEEVVV